jgi:hypothetical protein
VETERRHSTIQRIRIERQVNKLDDLYSQAEKTARQKLAAINRHDGTSHGADYLAMLTAEIYEQQAAARQINSIYEERRRA